MHELRQERESEPAKGRRRVGVMEKCCSEVRERVKGGEMTARAEELKCLEGGPGKEGKV